MPGDEFFSVFIYIYIYIYRERERVKGKVLIDKLRQVTESQMLADAQFLANAIFNPTHARN